MSITTRDERIATVDLDTSFPESIYLAAHALIWKATDPATYASFVEAQRDGLDVETEDEKFYADRASEALKALAEAGLLDNRVSHVVLEA